MTYDIDGRTAYDRVTIPESSRRDARSTNAVLHEMPVRRLDLTDIHGMLLFLPRLGIVVVPTHHGVGGWTCVVARGTASSYPRGVFLHFSDWELYRAEEVWIGTFNPRDEEYATRSSVGLGIWTLVPTPDIGDPPEDVPAGTISEFYGLAEKPDASQ